MCALVKRTSRSGDCAVVDICNGDLRLRIRIDHSEQYLLIVLYGLLDIAIRQVEFFFSRNSELRDLGIVEFDTEIHLMIVGIISIKSIWRLGSSQRCKEIMLVHHNRAHELMSLPTPYGRRCTTHAVINRYGRLQHHIGEEVHIDGT